MAFTEKQNYKIEVLENGALQIRRADIVLKDGVEVGRQYHRHCLMPGVDLTNEVQRVKDIAAATWTPEVVAAYEASLPKEEEVSTMPIEEKEVSTMPVEEEKETITQDIIEENNESTSD